MAVDGQGLPECGFREGGRRAEPFGGAEAANGKHTENHETYEDFDDAECETHRL